jgi:hypothetical protein
MTRPLALNDVLEVRAWTTCGNQAAVNTTFWMVNAVGGPPPTNQDAVGAFDAIFGPFYQGLLCPDARYNGCQLAMPLIVPQPLTVSSISAAGVGTFVGVTAARQAAGLIHLQTNFSGPRYRGRNFIPFIPAGGYAVDGTLTVAYELALALLANAIEGPVTVLGGGGTALCNPVIFHRSPTIVPRTTLVTNVAISRFIATQKRRGDFGRVNVSPI